jgi:nucleoside-diphosphate-sugar epimerase
VRALVTGGGGFLGGGVVDALLARGDDVTSLARGDYPALRERGVTTVRGDLTDPASCARALEGADVVFHVAAKAGYWGGDAAFRHSNVEGTRVLLDACRTAGVARFVFTSTPSVVHTGGDIRGGDESLPYATHFDSAYPETKAEAERLVLAANGPDLATVALRPHLVWGPGDTQLVPRSSTPPTSTTPSAPTSMPPTTWRRARPAPDGRTSSPPATPARSATWSTASSSPAGSSRCTAPSRCPWPSQPARRWSRCGGYWNGSVSSGTSGTRP